MKSAFARAEEKTYTYPDPLGSRKELVNNPLSAFWKGHIDEDVMAEIKKAQKDSGSSPAPTVTLRLPRSKRDRDRITELAQSIAVLDSDEGRVRQITETRIGYANRSLFEHLCEGWTGECFGDEEPSEEAFGRLDEWTAAWITACLIDVQDRARPDFQEPSTNSSRRPRRGRAESTPVSA